MAHISSLYYAPRVRRFKENKVGRDFCHGDIHGAFNLLWAALVKAHFDPAVDRLFSNGDLVDRGLESFRANRYLGLPYVAAVRGNHEDILIDLYRDKDPLVEDHPQEVLEFFAARFGMEWWLPLSAQERSNILQKVRQLPLVIEVETARGLVGLVHADVPDGMSWPEFIAAIEAGDEKTAEIALWGRKRLNSNNQKGVEGIGRVFVGHTIQWEGAQRYGNVYALDTGAIFGQENSKEGKGHLTVARLTAVTGLLANAQPAIQGLVNLQESTDEAPFGNYVVH